MALNAGLGFNLSASDNASFVFGKVGKSLGALKSSAEDTGLSFDKLTNRVRDANTGRFAKQEGIFNIPFLSEVGDKLKGIAVAMAGVGAAIFAGLGVAAKASAEFAQSAAKVATIADAAQFPLGKIRDIGFEMGQAYGGDLNTQLDALYSAIGSGAQTAADGTMLMHAANKLAIGGLTTVDVSMNGLMGTLNAYGMAYSRATEVTDAFFQSVMLGGSDMAVSTLANGLGNITPLASAMNVSLDEMLGGLARLTAMGQKTDIAITNLKGAMEVMLKPNADAVKEAKRLGIQFDQNSLKSKGFLGTIKDITSATGYNAESMTKLFGQSTTGLGAMLALGGDGGVEFGKFMEAMGDKTGKTEFAFKTLADTGVFAASVLKANLQTTLTKIGDVVAPVIGAIMMGANKLLTFFNNLPESVHQAVVWIAVFTAAVLITAAGVLAAVIGIGMMVMAWKVVAISALIAAGAIGIALAAIIPLVLIGAALYTAWNKNLGGFRDTVTNVMNTVRLAFQGVSQLLSSGSFSGSVMKELDAGHSGIKKFAINVFLWFNRIKNFFVGIGQGFSEGLLVVMPTFDAIITAVKTIVRQFLPLSKGPAEARSTWASFAEVGKTVGRVFAAIVGVIAGVVNAFMQFYSGVAVVLDYMGPTLNQLWLAVKNTFGAFALLFTAFSGGSNSAVTFGTVMKVLGGIIGFLLGVIGQTAVAIVGVMGGALNIIGGVIGGVVGLIWGLITAVFDLGKIIGAVLTGEWGTAWQYAGDFVRDIINGIMDLVTGLLGGIAGAVDSIAGIFGKDLGAKLSVTSALDTLRAGYVKGIPSSAAPGAPAPASTAPAGQPGVAASQAQVAAYGAGKIGPPAPPTNVNVKSQLVLDGQVIAEANQKATADANNRGLGPTSPPTG